MSRKTIQHSDEQKGKFKLPKLFSDLKPNTHLLHLAVLRQLNNKRAGTASTKTRDEVRGGGKKPWQQKGTGRARAGSIRSPLWVGGGISFGPKPRDYSFDMPQKERNLAIVQAIALKNDDIVILKKLPELKEVKTKVLLSNLKSLGLDTRPLLLICDSGEPFYNEVKKASKNIQAVNQVDHNFVGVYDILKANKIIITETAMNQLEKRFSKLFGKKVSKIA